MENTTNVFCILSKTGGGKSEYMNRIVSDHFFMKKNDLSLLVYGTTRNRRKYEKDGVDYYYHTQEEYDNIPDSELVESRSYYTLNDGTIYYFTKAEYFNKKSKNVICITSPFQYENYRNWFAKENIKGNHKYRIFMIILETDLRIRIDRISKRANSDKDLYEMCRRIVEEKNEFEDVQKRIPELIDPMMSTNVCYINNNDYSEESILENIDKIKTFIEKSNE